MKTTKITNNLTKLFHSDNFISMGFDGGKLNIKRVDKHHRYSPRQGWLLFDVDVYFNSKINSISIIGKKFTAVKPKRHFLGLFAVLDEKTVSSIHVYEEDIYFSVLGFSFVKYQYYYNKKEQSFNKCFFNIPMVIQNCFKEEEDLK